jgi:D-alanyl-D-alanine carboxypeptidase
MKDLEIALTGIVNRPLEGRGAAGIAASTAATAEPVAVWVPASAQDEPGYLVYSITKTFTAVLFLLLRDENRLTLDDRLARWFPGIPGADRISLRQLLNHTAGIPDYGGLRSYHDAVRACPSTPWSFERFAAETFEKGLRFEPGTDWAYSNPGYMLLKRIAEEVAGTAYATLISERIVCPLGLRRTFVPESQAELGSLAPALSRALALEGTPREVRDHYHPGWVSHGVVASTPSDIARFFGALFCRRLVSSQALREMTTLVPIQGAPAMPSPSWGKPGYGLGIVGIPESPFGPLWGHNGGGPGYRASAYHAPNLGDVSVCAMCSVEEDSPEDQLVFAALAALRGPNPPSPPVPRT